MADSLSVSHLRSLGLCLVHADSSSSSSLERRSPPPPVPAPQARVAARQLPLPEPRPGKAGQTKPAEEERKCCQGEASVSNISYDGVALRSGIKVPQLGFGTFLLKAGGDCRDAVRCALKTGYRLIDTAALYQNEVDVGEALSSSGLAREEVYLVTKLQPLDHHGDQGVGDKVEQALRTSLEKLNVSNVDLFLVHNPKGGNVVAVWKSMLRVRDLGLAKAVGVSNFGIQHLKGLKEEGLEMPEVNQIELHCWWQQEDILKLHEEEGIVTMAYSPLARGQRFSTTGKSVLGQIAKSHGRSEAATAIRWALQSGHIVIPKSRQEQRIRENFESLSFQLAEKEMEKIKSLNENFRSMAGSSSCMELSWEEVKGPLSAEALEKLSQPRRRGKAK